MPIDLVAVSHEAAEKAFEDHPDVVTDDLIALTKSELADIILAAMPVATSLREVL